MSGRRILFVSPFAFLGGAEQGLLAAVRLLPERGYDPGVALLRDGPLGDRLRELGIPVEIVPAGRIRQLRRGVRTIRGLQATAIAHGSELVVSNMSTAHIYGGVAARRLRRPAVLWQQVIPARDYGGPSMSHRGVERLAARVPAAAVVVLSAEAAAAQRDLTPHADLRTVPPGVDLDRIRAALGAGAAVRRQLGVGDAPLVGIVGWLEPWKGQDVFLRAAALLAHGFPTAHFVVVGGPGDADFAARLRRLVDELGLAGRVHLVGHQADPFPWLDAFDVAVHASYGEAFGLVVVEAMALGTPVVATRPGGPSEVIGDGAGGSLVEPGDPHALADAVEALLADPALRASTGAAGRVRAERFTEAAMVDGLAAVFDDVLAGRQPPGGALAPQ